MACPEREDATGVPGIRRAYRHASLALRLPMWGGFRDWASPIVDVPFVARHSARPAAEVRRALEVPADHRIALVSFGGLGISGLPLEALDRSRGRRRRCDDRVSQLEAQIPGAQIDAHSLTSWDRAVAAGAPPSGGVSETTRCTPAICS